MKRFARPSLIRRVAWGSALAAALGGLVAAVAGGATARRLVDAHEVAELRDALEEMAEEMDEALESRHHDDEVDPVADGDVTERWLTERLRHELNDLHGRATVASLWRDGAPLAGDTGDTLPAPGRCLQTSLGAMPHRLCATDFHGSVLTVGEPLRGERERDSLLAYALLIGLACGAVLGGAGSMFISSWALAPLTALRDQIRRVRPDHLTPRGLRETIPEVELEELRVAIVDLFERLDVALGQARAFAAEAAHELRTPLTTIGGELEMMSEGADDSDAVHRVRGQVGHLVELVQRLLVLAQPDSPETLQGEVIDLSDIVASSVEATPHAERLRVQVGEDVLVRGDPALLRALFVNAIENALKFSSGAIDVHVSQDQGRARLVVRDDGPGLSDEEQRRVFEPFYRTATSRAGGAPGHGLGLALIARVARLHGGSARFEGVPRGACLVVEIPVWRAERGSSRPEP